MNGPEHYAEAERVRKAIRTPSDASAEGFDGWQRDDLIALAQFHATMAHAAASLYPTPLAPVLRSPAVTA